MGLSTILTASVLALRLFSLPTGASPTPQDDGAPAPAVDSPAPAVDSPAPVDSSAPANSPAPTNPYDPIGASASGWWMSSIKRQGKPAFNQADYKVFRNVKDYGARGDGSTDDTDAINRAITEGNRCGQKCDSQTTTPAIVYFPPGTYLVSKPIVPYYYTQLIGDAVDMPTIKARQGFEGIAVIDSDPYEPSGANWWTNQNNFFRQVRNFRIDLTGLPKNTGTGIHWQGAQATEHRLRHGQGQERGK
ncbi:glucan 1,3-beta-glucosidase GLUC78 precursor [Ophiocordyceps sinensis CO18]|uniref:Glucan 1,3-beta-glucosidase GLUC78 n=1 Tax=Ophiocordyceps sinensis (strain Co18 / CGMCC 3.14243) TaxID=911162 RepID=T5ACZ7_OPHSC|nr:glucan 1,3-beta-glucosidase GLUC78 precursor [Ophiocordyceps sinensis CO18]